MVLKVSVAEYNCSSLFYNELYSPIITVSSLQWIQILIFRQWLFRLCELVLNWMIIDYNEQSFELIVTVLWKSGRGGCFLFRIWLSRRCLMCSEQLFIPNFEPFKIHYFHSHFLGSPGPDYFLFLISIREVSYYKTKVKWRRFITWMNMHENPIIKHSISLRKFDRVFANPIIKRLNSSKTLK